MNEDHLDPDRHGVTPGDFDEEQSKLLAALGQGYDTGRWGWDVIDVCLTGKDADLEPWGQQGIQILRCEEKTVTCAAHGGKTFAGSDVCLNTPDGTSEEEEQKYLDAYLEQAQLVVADCPATMADWDGDAWFLTFYEEFTVPWVFAEADDIIDYNATAAAIVDQASKVLAPWEEAVVTADETLDRLSGWRDTGDTRCPEGRPSSYAAWLTNTVALQ